MTGVEEFVKDFVQTPKQPIDYVLEFESLRRLFGSAISKKFYCSVAGIHTNTYRNWEKQYKADVGKHYRELLEEGDGFNND